MVQLKITPNLTCNGQTIDLNRGIWFEVAIDEGKKYGTHSVYKDTNLAEALKFYYSTRAEYPNAACFIDAWAFPTGDSVPYPIDQFSFEEM